MEPVIISQEGPGLAGAIKGGTSRTKITGKVGTTVVSSSSSGTTVVSFSTGNSK
jgi:hypothetical protein